MSTINSKNVQVGTSSTAAENFTLYQPATPDGTVRLGVGNSGATTADVVTVNSAGVTVTGTLTATSLSGALGAATATSLTVAGNNISAVNSLGFRNRILNGDCRIDQRNAGASVTVSGAGGYTLDRWNPNRDGVVNNFTCQRSSVAPTGFVNSMLFTMGTGVTPTTTAYAYFAQNIEGFNTADLGFGTASASTVTLSFWVRSSVTGTFGVGLRNSSGGRSYIASYTIIAANTWEQKTVTIAGDTSGTWLTDNGIGIRVDFDLGVGPTYSTTSGSWQSGNFFGLTGGTKLAATTGATFYITGVQLEAGTVASPFERRDYGRELAMCQRYFKQINGSANFTAFASGVVRSPATNFRASFTYNTMRAAPTITFGGTIYVAYGAGDNSGVTLSTIYAGTDGAILDCAIGAGATTGSGGILYTNNNATGFVNLSSEL